MKICITSTGPDLDSPVDPRFGRCQHFLIISEKGKLIKSVANEGVRAMGGAGITAAQIVANEGINIVITGNIGPNAFMVLNQVGIKIYLGAFNISSREALDMFNQGKLTLARAPVPPFGPRRRGFGGRGGRARRGKG